MAFTLLCPACQTPLRRWRTRAGMFSECPACKGSAVGLGVLRKSRARQYIDAVWLLARAGVGPHKRACPACRRAMIEVPAQPIGDTPVPVDVCLGCQLVWFDADEWARLGGDIPLQDVADAGAAGQPILSAKARELLALRALEVDSAKRRHKENMENAYRRPENPWAYLPAMIGLPIEEGVPPLQRPPVVTWLLVGICTVVTGLASTAPGFDFIIGKLGFLPADPLRWGGITLLSTFFLHAGILHLLGNMYFLWIFGDNVEDHLGQWMYLALLFGATVAGALTHAAFAPDPNVPLVGASGGVSGVLLFYALAFPDARIGVFFWRAFLWLWMRPRTWIALWILLQAFGAWKQLHGFSQVSALGHLGGALFGLALFFVWRSLRHNPAPRPAKAAA